MYCGVYYNYAKVHVLPLPSQMARFNDYSITLLPSDTTKASVHRNYVSRSKQFQSESNEPIRTFGYREFCRLWPEVVPYIRVMPPAEDICHICQENATRILQCSNLSEDEKSKNHLEAQEHPKHVKDQRYTIIGTKKKKVRKLLSETGRRK